MKNPRFKCSICRKRRTIAVGNCAVSYLNTRLTVKIVPQEPICRQCIKALLENAVAGASEELSRLVLKIK